MQNLTQPTLLLKPFAESGDKNTLPVTNTDASNPQLADLTNGFPQITSESPDDGGLPPERKDFNGLGYLTTTYDFFYQAGGTFTFNATISSAIGGYPKDARLWYTDSNGATTILRSTKNNNTDNFITTPSYIGTSWVAEIPALAWNNIWTGNNTFSGSTTFSGSVGLGSSATATTPSITDNSTLIATTAMLQSWANTNNAGALSSWKKAQKGYYKFKNGLIVQWGKYSGASGTVTFETPFTSGTSYSVSTGYIGSERYDHMYGVVNTLTSTGFNLVTFGSGSACHWIAIGY